MRFDVSEFKKRFLQEIFECSLASRNQRDL
jgi:hypothetical protein